MTVPSLDDTRDGWAEELVTQFAGWDAAQRVVDERARSQQNAGAGLTFQGRPVYGMQGAVLLDGGQVQ